MEHIPVLKNEITDQFKYLSKKSGAIFVDGTIGAGNHSIAIASYSQFQIKKHKFVAIDKDQSALDIAKINIEKAGLNENFIFIHDDFKNLINVLKEEKIEKIDGALIDLGVSSMQLDQKSRGFSFTEPTEKLDMRMDQTQELSAHEVLNKYPEKRLEYILKNYGEENFARQIATQICEQRKNRSIETVGDLLFAIEKVIPIRVQKTSKIHFATRTFQAIRIEVNQELENLSMALKDFVSILKPGGKLAVIAFHSLEDRIVKNTFRELAATCSCPPNAPVCTCDKKAEIVLINKKPIVATEEEIEINPRSRSAKLRIVEKI
jgi:16S rRNA (cytosine1402-N4)-methyltransferase